MQQHYKRSRLFIDESVQTAVLFRAAWYWVACLIGQMLMTVFFAAVNSAAGDPRFWWHLQLTVLAAAALLPLILWDLLKLSHRWVGPIYRLRESLRALGRGEAAAPVFFRKYDFWQDLAFDLNKVSQELALHRKNATAETTIASSSASSVESTTTADTEDRSQTTTEAIVI